MDETTNELPNPEEMTLEEIQAEVRRLEEILLAQGLILSTP